MKQRPIKNKISCLNFIDKIFQKYFIKITNKELLIFIIISFLLLWPNNKLTGQSGNEGLFFTDPDTKVLRIPFKLINNLIIIPLQINNSDSLYFILDTGVKNTIITELTAEDSLVLNYARKINLKGLGINKEVEAYQSVHNNVRLLSGTFNKRIVGNDENIYVLIDTTVQFTRFFGTKINGVIGSELFNNFIVRIDYMGKVLSFYNPEKYPFEKKTRKGTTFPLEIYKSKPILKCNISQSTGNSIQVNMLLDTGASLSAWLLKETKSGINIPEKTIDTHIGHGLGGEIRGKMGRIKELSIGKYILPQAIISYPDSGSISYNFSDSNRNGTIGAEILRRFRIIFDYKNNRINLKPNNDYKQKFNYNMSGIQIASPYPGFPLYIIDYINPGSPGDIAGLQPDDQIFKLNNKAAVKLSLNDITNAFTSNSDKTITLTILRNGKKLFYKIRLIPEI